jgi:hypothetical protein
LDDIAKNLDNIAFFMDMQPHRGPLNPVIQPLLPGRKPCADKFLKTFR